MKASESLGEEDRTEGWVVPTFWELIEKAMAAGRAEDYAEAKRCYQAAFEIDAGHAPFWAMLSIAHRELGESEAEIAAAKKAIELDPNNGSRYPRLGSALSPEPNALPKMPVIRCCVR